MIDLLRWALNRPEQSKDAARRRLHLILVLDRVGLATSQVEAMKKDIIDAISKYLVVDENTIEVDMARFGDSLVLSSNVHVRDFLRAAVAS